MSKIARETKRQREKEREKCVVDSGYLRDSGIPISAWKICIFTIVCVIFYFGFWFLFFEGWWMHVLIDCSMMNEIEKENLIVVVV